MLNTQAPQKLVRGTPDLVVHSIFPTIQGEGPFAGYPATFVRLSGCNLQCPLCDTDYTGGVRYRGADLLKKVADARLVVITGGEPFRQPEGLVDFVWRCSKKGILVQIETNGTLRAPDDLLSSAAIVVSPKTGSVHRSILVRAKAWKYVARAQDIDDTDGLPNRALDHPAVPRLARPPAGAKVYLQPADEQDDTLNYFNTKAVVQSCLTHGHILCLQLHKIVGVA